MYDLEKIIGERLRKIRRGKGLSLQDVADRVETTPQTIQRLETDNMTLTIKWVERICPALGIEPATLFSNGQTNVAASLSLIADKLAEIEIDICEQRTALRRLAQQTKADGENERT